VRNAYTSNLPSSNSNSRTASPVPGTKGRIITGEQKAQNEAYFSRMGEANASRPDSLPPSQGGKYAGFGSAMPEPAQSSTTSSGGSGIPSADEFQQNPIGALTKGLGWFSTAVTKQAKMVNDAYIQPTAKNVRAWHFLPCLPFPRSHSIPFIIK
jgi:ADP-ribosylation factor GTPase-activating protein 1